MMSNRARPCRLWGRRYPSLTQAALALGVEPSTVSSWCESPKQPCCQFEPAGAKPGTWPQAVEVVIEGRRFHSILEASKTLGISRQTVRDRIYSKNELFTGWKLARKRKA